MAGAVTLSRRQSAGLLVLILGVVAVVIVVTGPLGKTWIRWLAVQPNAADVGFAQDMSVHHEQAVLMASLADGRAGPAIKAMSQGIVLSQSQQIGVMRGWLQLWSQPPVAETPMLWAPHGIKTDAANDSGHSGDLPLMAGMASGPDLVRLWGLNGDEFDVFFLQLMIRHHRGGVDMAHHAMESARVEAVQDLAKAMIVEQAHDLSKMLRLLSLHGAKELPFVSLPMCRTE